MQQIRSCHDDLQKIIALALVCSDVDFAVVEGHRPVEKQQEYFAKGLSKVDGIHIKGKHNFNPSHAFDVIVYVKGKKSLAYDKAHLSFLAGVITTVAKILWEQGEVGHLIRWGGNWDKDGEIIADQSFIDLPHFEMYIP